MATRQRTRTKKTKTNGRAKSGRAQRSRTVEVASSALKTTFAGRYGELVGIALCVTGAIFGLSIYLEAAGPLGEVIASSTGWLLGLVRFLLPVAMVAGGLTLIRSEEGDEEPTVTMAVGAVLGLVAVVGILHMAGGQPTFDDGPDGLGKAGGAIGLAIANPLQALIGAAATVVVLSAIALVAITVLGQSNLRPAPDKSTKPDDGDGGGPEASRQGLLSRMYAALVGFVDDDVIDLTGDSPTVVVGGEADDDATALFDQDDGSLPAKPRERKAPKLVAPAPDDDAADDLEIVPKRSKPSNWTLPPLKLLHRVGRSDVDRRSVEERGRFLEQALSQHGVETRLVGMVVGPTVTRFELELAPGVKVSRVTSLNKDIAYAMASPDVRILAPIPGRQAIGVEVPNETREVVAIGDLLASPEVRRADHPLEVPMGRDINGRTLVVNLATMPHVLIAGATGAGKSSCINTLITSILMRTTPEQVRMILVDPKRVEMGQYERVPHLLTQPVTDPKKAANALAWAVREMERRYDLLSECGFRDITGYNEAFDKGDIKAGLGEVGDDGEPRQFSRLPFILVVVDELADLMMVAARDVEDSICRIAQMARAVGIHLVIATQRPSVNVITGVIKANIPARLAFAVSSLADSRVILDQPGAERLVGKGDMLHLGPASNVPQRIQGAWVDEEEVRAVVKVWRDQAPDVVESAGVDLGGGSGSESGDAGATTPSITEDQPRSGPGGGDDEDELLQQAMELVVSSQLGSTSMLQRKLRVGFARAGRIMDLLEQRGVVGPSEGSKARTVLMTPEELDS